MLGNLERGSDGVCGGSSGFNAGLGCSGAVSWEAARDFCENVGARLCTEQEILNDETKATVRFNNKSLRFVHHDHF